MLRDFPKVIRLVSKMRFRTKKPHPKTQTLAHYLCSALELLHTVGSVSMNRMDLCPADKKHFSYSLRLRGAPVGNRQLRPDRIKGLPISSEMHVHPPKAFITLPQLPLDQRMKMEQGPGFEETGWL